MLALGLSAVADVRESQRLSITAMTSVAAHEVSLLAGARSNDRKESD